MSPARLLEHFDRLVDTPDAVPRLRRFILDLAVRGKLVEQDPKDEPAGELLKRIEDDERKAVKKGGIRRRKELPCLDTELVVENLPPNWRVVPLIRLGTWAIGSGFPKNEQGSNEEPYYFLKVSDMNLRGNEKYIRSANNTIDANAAARMSARIHPPGTIIFPKIGGAIATNKRRILTRPSAIDNNCLGITFAPLLAVDWCYLLLTTLDFTKYQAGTAVPALQQGVLETIPIWLPPVAEQHRIVAKVDELMALCDELEVAQTKREKRRDRLVAATLHGLNNGDATPTPGAPSTFEENARFYFNHIPRLTTRPEHIHQLRQTILNLAVRGKLVPQDPNDEVAGRLLEHIRHEKYDKRKQKDFAQDKEPESFYEIPKSWAWSTLGELAQDFRYGTSKKCSYVEIGHPVLRIPNVRGGKISTDDLKFTTLTVSEVEDLSLVVGDILLIRSNGSLNLVGRPALVEKHAEGFCYAGYLVRVRFFSGTVAAPYLIIALNSELVRDQIEGPIRSAVGLKNINSTEFSNLAIPFPPLSEQHRIVAKFDELMVLCAGLESRITATAAIQQGLLEATIHEALS